MSADRDTLHCSFPPSTAEGRLARALALGCSSQESNELRDAVLNFVEQQKARRLTPREVTAALEEHARRSSTLHPDHPAFAALVARLVRWGIEAYDPRTASPRTRSPAPI